MGAEFYKFHLGNGWQQKFVRMWAVSVSHQGKSTAGRDNNKAKSYNCDVSVDFTALTLAPFLPKATIFLASSSIPPLTNTHHKKALSLTSMPLKTKQKKMSAVDIMIEEFIFLFSASIIKNSADLLSSERWCAMLYTRED